jgi:LCP family protein required for cell wall assembly
MVAKLEEKLIKQRRLRRRRVLVVIGLLTLLAVVAAIASYLWFGGKIGARRAKVNKSPDTEHYIVPPNKLNIMIMGVDERPQEDDPGRSDTLLVMTIDTESREASIVSVPRDTRLRIKGLGWDKVNHAFSVGGVALTRQTTETFLGIPMDYYAKINLESFGRIVDAIGGVTIDVEKRMQYEDTWDHYVIDLKPGVQRLDGRAALQYVRYRDEEGDIGRIARQQKFIKAVLAEVSSPAIILKAPSIIREVFASLDTDMPIGLMMGLARKLKDGLSGGFKPHMVEGLPYYIDDISYWVPDIVKTRQMVAEMQGVPFEGNVRIAAQRAADEYRQAFPANAHLDDGTYYPGMDQASKQAKPGQKTPTTAPVKPVVPPAKAQSPTTPTKPASTPPVKPTTPTKPTSALPARVAIGLNNGV